MDKVKAGHGIPAVARPITPIQTQWLDWKVGARAGVCLFLERLGSPLNSVHAGKNARRPCLRGAVAELRWYLNQRLRKVSTAGAKPEDSALNEIVPPVKVVWTMA